MSKVKLETTPSCPKCKKEMSYYAFMTIPHHPRWWCENKDCTMLWLKAKMRKKK